MPGGLGLFAKDCGTDLSLLCAGLLSIPTSTAAAACQLNWGDDNGAGFIHVNKVQCFLWSGLATWQRVLRAGILDAGGGWETLHGAICRVAQSTLSKGQTQRMDNPAVPAKIFHEDLRSCKATLRACSVSTVLHCRVISGFGRHPCTLSNVAVCSLPLLADILYRTSRQLRLGLHVESPQEILPDRLQWLILAPLMSRWRISRACMLHTGWIQDECNHHWRTKKHHHANECKRHGGWTVRPRQVLREQSWQFFTYACWEEDTTV